MKKSRLLTAVAAALFCMTVFPVPAFAQSNEPVEETTSQPTAAAEPNPLTPDGTGTVLDSVTENDGKQFYTITTPAGNTFYLIIDSQRDSQNVYFLDAAQEKDLLALAEADEQDVTGETAGEPQAEATPEPTNEPETDQPDQEKSAAATQSSRTGMIMILVVMALAVGGVGYYFKIVKPQKALDDADDFDEIEFEDGPEINEDDAPEALPEPDNAAELEDDAK